MLVIRQADVHRINILVLQHLLVIVIDFDIPIALQSSVESGGPYIIVFHCGNTCISAQPVHIADSHDACAGIPRNPRHVMRSGNPSTAY